MRRGGWARSGGTRRHLRRISEACREIAKTLTPAMAAAIPLAMGVLGGPLACPDAPDAEHPYIYLVRVRLRELASLHVLRAVRRARNKARTTRARHLRLARCMALFTRRLALSGTSATRRSPGATTS
ncbi:hypothetical protein GCM10009639_48050 [Kitasatospora putterlickiae]|uniref:Transposase n=1 Tax=Kitasatospora putterlickiae TaxID=221725 RepID=A0ABN1YBS1_9ACTN